MERTQRTRLASILILCVVFGAGLLVGMAVDRTAAANPVAESADGAAADEDRPDGPEERRTPMYAQVGELTAEQEARIDSVVSEFRARTREMHRQQEEEAAPWREKWDARFDSLVEATRADIRAAMTPEQATRYDSLVAEYERRREERRREREESSGRN